MSHKHFAGEVTLAIHGQIVDVDEPQLSTAVDIVYTGQVKAQLGLTRNDLLSGWLVTEINGRDVLLPSYSDGIVKAIGMLVQAMTDPSHRLHLPLVQLMRAGRLIHGIEGEEGQEDGNAGAGAPLRRPATARVQRRVPGLVPPDQRPLRRR